MHLALPRNGVLGQGRFGRDNEVVRRIGDAHQPLSPYGRTTSRIEVDTTGLPAARYSGVLVGLMKRVASLRANGSSATSQPAR